jgi:hypothetical protein
MMDGGSALQPDGGIYRIAGWTLRSPRPLPYLVPATDEDADIAISFERLAEPSQPPLFSAGPYRVYAPDHIEVCHPSGLRIQVRAGNRLIVDAPPDCDDAELHTFLFGPAFAVLCHQRGAPPLHASAVVFGGAALAVTGDVGAGKSTTTMALIKRGGLLLADDQLVVSPETAMAAAGFPSLKLWSQTADWFGAKTESAARVQRDLDKFHLRVPSEFYPEAAPLKVLFLLTPDLTLTVPVARLLPRVEAIATLDRMIYRTEFAQAFGSKPDIFTWASKLSGLVPLYHVRRPNDLARLDALVDRLLDIAASHGVARGKNS